MTVAVFALFMALLLGCLIAGIDIEWAVLVGLFMFFGLGLSRGYKAGMLVKLAWEKGKQSMHVNLIMVLVGGITGLWRASGTIAYCIYHGIRFITPELFIFLCFLICAVLSYILGTSFGVISTAGVILMSLARFGGVNEFIAAGAVISGAYVGDRGSPASSSAHLVAAVTGTDIRRNVPQMMKTGLIPLLICTVLHGVLSWVNPLQSVDASITAELASLYHFHPVMVLPAVVMLVLPLFKIGIEIAMCVSMAVAAVVAVAVQRLSIAQVFLAMLTGFRVEGELGNVLSGGGMISMALTCVLILLTALYSGILQGIHVLEPISEKLLAMAGKLGRYPTTLLTSLGASALFCNQTIAVMLTEQLLHDGYEDREEMAMDIENTAIMIAGLVPWSIASSAPRAMLDIGPKANVFALLLWMTPLVYLFTKNLFYPEKRQSLKRK